MGAPASARVLQLPAMSWLFLAGLAARAWPIAAAAPV